MISLLQSRVAQGALRPLLLTTLLVLTACGSGGGNSEPEIGAAQSGTGNSDSSGTATGTGAGTTTNTTAGTTTDTATGATTPASLIGASNNAPAIFGTPANAVIEDESYFFMPVATDADGDKLTFSIENKPEWAIFDNSTGALSGTPDSQQIGPFLGIVISVDDGKIRTVLPPFDITVVSVGTSVDDINADNNAPVIDGNPGTVTLVDKEYRFDPVVSDTDGDTLSFQITGQPMWASFNTATGSLFGTPSSLYAGTASTIIISVNDGKATTSLPAFTLSVESPNREPVFSGVPASTVFVGDLYSFNPGASDEDGDELTFAVTNLPWWATFDKVNGTLTGVPEFIDIGLHEEIVITVSDGKASSSIEPFSINVVLDNTAPILSGTPLLSVAGGAEYVFEPMANDVDNDPLTFSITNKPEWAEFDTATGIVSGTPDNSHVGDYPNIMIAVSDGVETSQLDAFSVTVTYGNTAPVISGIPATYLLPNESFSFTPTVFDDNPNTTLSFSAENLPAWATLDIATGNISGTPSEEALHSGIILRVSDGEATADLPFFIRVKDVQDFARRHGVATQGSQYNSSEAQFAIDGDESTINHTQCEDDVNWWQVEMPAEIEISRIEVLGRDGQAVRLGGAELTVSNTPYDDLPENTPVRATLAASKQNQVFEFDPPLSGSHVAIKADASSCLHMREVKVFGVGPDAPIVATSTGLGLPVPVSVDDWVGTLDAQDLQGDTLNYSLGNQDIPFAIDTDGRITVIEPINHNSTQQFQFQVIVSDSVNESVTDVTVGLLDQPGVQLERWNDIPGSLVSDLTSNAAYLGSPDLTEIIGALDVPDSAGNDHGVVLTAVLRPEVSGTYYLSIAGNDATALEFSSSSLTPADAVRVIERNGKSNYQDWKSSYESAPVRLRAGEAYFIKAIMKERGFAAHVSVGWRFAGEAAYQLIPANQLYVGAINVETTKPQFSIHETSYLLGQASTTGALLTTINASDAQNDALVFSIEEAVPFTVDQNGAVTVAGTLMPDTVYTFNVTVSDGVHNTRTELTVTTTVPDEVDHAITTGDASVVSSDDLLEDAILDTIEDGRNLHRDAIIQIFNLDPDASPKSDGSSLTQISWNPTRDAALFENRFNENTILLQTNSVIEEGYELKEWTIGVLGESGGRYIALGGNPMRNYRRDNQAINEQMHLMLENSLSWLTQRSDLKTGRFNVVMANLAQNSYNPDELALREWLDERFPGQANYNVAKSCDGGALAGCINPSTDLVIVSQHTDAPGSEQAVADAVAEALENGIPILYLHYDGNLRPLGELLLELFDTTRAADNRYHRLGLNAASPVDHIGALPAEISSVKAMIENLSNDSFNISWSDCELRVCETNEEAFASSLEQATLKLQFKDAAGYIRSAMQDLDKNKVNIFANPDKYRLEKLWALLGDYYRTRVVFPMDKFNTSSAEYMRALYADHSDYQHRDKVGTWGNLGNFSRTDFSHITPTTRTVNHVSRIKFRSTGAYALPGQQVSVTRNDSSDVAVGVFVNTTRSGSTHYLAPNGYKRPINMKAESIPIEPGETIRFISSIGGPIQLSYDKNDLPIEVVIENIGEHAYWSNASDNDSFGAKLLADEFDWAEVVAPSFEVHSTTSKMNESMNDPVLLENVGVPQALVDTIMEYVHNQVHVLAGFKGPGIDVVDEIHQFAADNGLEIQNLDIVKHMNADQASCGAGCSGNPYDANWSFSPIGHGDIHELGHGLERDRFRLTNWQVHSTTNPYSYFTKSQWHKATGVSLASVDSACQGLPFESMYTQLQASIGDADPADYLRRNLWTTIGGDIAWSTSFVFTIQMMMSAEDNGALVDGWHLLARMHIIEREYQNAVKNDDLWALKKDGLGMSLYERTAAQALGREDWVLITVSHATGFDFRNYFDTFGHSYTAEASAQVAALSLPAMPVNFYVSSATGYCEGEGFDGNKLPIDGVSAWPLD